MSRFHVLLNCSPSQLGTTFGIIIQDLADYINLVERWQLFRFVVFCYVGRNRTVVKWYSLSVFIGNSLNPICILRLTKQGLEVDSVYKTPQIIHLEHPDSLEVLRQEVALIVDKAIQSAQSTGWEPFQ